MNQRAAALPHSQTMPAILGRAAQLLGVQDYEGAVSLLLSAHQIVVAEPVACNTLAYLLVQLDRPQEAVFWFDTSLALRPDDFKALTGLGMALQTSG
ncbi:MAG: hypothetical protein ABWY49_08865, partial [Rhizobium sp.]